MMRRRRHWLHCTQDDHGPRFTARRIVPPRYHEVNEPPVPRLCVCPTLAGCFSAQFFMRRGPVYVYRTTKETSGIFPGKKRVWDCIITREHWLVPPVEMVKIDAIPYEGKVEEIAWPRYLYYKLTGPDSKFRIRVAEYALAAEVLGREKEDRIICEYFKGEIGINKSPTDYIIDEADRICEERDKVKELASV